MVPWSQEQRLAAARAACEAALPGSVWETLSPSAVEMWMRVVVAAAEAADQAEPSVDVAAYQKNEVLMQLFVEGPTWDGDLISKTCRDELVDAGLADRWEGWNFLSEQGLRVAVAGGRAARHWADLRWYRKATNQPWSPR